MTAAQAIATNGRAPSLEVLDGQIVVLPLASVDLDDENDRIDWESADAVADLKDLAFMKIGVHGFMTRFAPMLIVQEGNGRYKVKDGNRRTAAMKMLYEAGKCVPRGPGLPPYPLGYAPFTISEGKDDQAIRLEALLSNVGRRDLNDLEAARAYMDVLRTGVPFLIEGDVPETIHAKLNEDEIALVRSMSTVVAADIKQRLGGVQAQFQDWRLDRLSVYDIVVQMMQTCTNITKIESFIKRLMLLNLIMPLQEMVVKGQMTINFATAIAPLDTNHQYKALEKWNQGGGKMDLQTWQAMCLALAENQAAGDQLGMFDGFDDDFWTIQVVEAANNEGRKRKGKRYGLDADKAMLAALDEIKVSRSLPNTDTALALVAETLKRTGNAQFARYVNAVREKLLGDYFTNVADTGAVLAMLADKE